MRKSSVVCLVVALAFVTINTGCTTAPPDGNGGNGGNGGGGGNNLPEDAAPIQDTGGFFEADRAWAIIAPSVFVGGYGTHVEFVSISTGPAAPVCVGMDPANASVAFDGEKFQILTHYAGAEFGDSCRLQITADAGDCAPNSLGYAPSPCDLSNVEADVTIDGTSTTVEAPQIVRFSQCDPLLLSSRNEWLISSGHPFAILLLQDPGSVGAVFVAAGQSDDFQSANLITGADGAVPLGCFDETVDNNMLSYDLERLSIDVTMNDDGDCTTTFEGNVVYCALLNPADLGGTPGQSTAVVRVEGSGGYTSADGNGDFNVMYLSYPSGPNGGGGCGNVRCKAIEQMQSMWGRPR